MLNAKAGREGGTQTGSAMKGVLRPGVPRPGIPIPEVLRWGTQIGVIKTCLLKFLIQLFLVVIS